MSLWAIIPVKPLRRGKSRLAAVLNDDDRAALNRNLLAHTVSTLQKVKQIEHVLVVSRDPEALALARDYRAKTIREDGSPELNVALKRAAILAQAYRASRLLIVPADLPFLAPEEVEKVIQAASPAPCVVIVPDRHHEGTNVLYLSPPDIIPFDYGPHSFTRHSQHAQRAGASLMVCENPALALDVDYPEDLDMVDGLLDLKVELPVGSADGHDFDELVL